MKRIAILLLSLLFVLTLGPSSAFSSPQITRFPYVQCPTTSSVTLVWETDIPARCSVRYGLTPEMDLEAQAEGRGNNHVAVLTDLEPNRTYYYRLLAEGIPLTEAFTFRTNKDESRTEFSFIVFGDSGSGDENQMRVAEQMARVKADLGLNTGDIVRPSGALGDYNAKYFQPYQELLSSMCFYPAPGNHDLREQHGKPFLDVFHLPANNPQKSERYYSFDYANTHFVCIDTNLPLNEKAEKAQFDWLRKDLAATQKPWRFVLMHHPPYSSGKHGSYTLIRKRYSPVFEEYSVDIVFCGHDHDYERTVKMRDFFPDGSGVIYIVTGGGGAPLYNVRRSAWTVFSKKTFHFLLVAIEGNTLKLSAIDDNGREFDALSLDKGALEASGDKSSQMGPE